MLERGQSNMNELIIDIVCPVYKDYEQIKNLLYSIKKQERIIIKNFRFFGKYKRSGKTAS